MVEDVQPQDTWAVLQRDARGPARRRAHDAEWTFVGVPDLTAAGKQVLTISWQVPPTMAVNPDVRRAPARGGARARAPDLFHLPQRRAQPGGGGGRGGGRIRACLQRRRRIRGSARPRGPSRHGGRLEGGEPALAAAVAVAERRRRARPLSCPGLSRAPTPPRRRPWWRHRVDGRDRPGHDGVCGGRRRARDARSTRCGGARGAVSCPGLSRASTPSRRRPC